MIKIPSPPKTGPRRCRPLDWTGVTSFSSTVVLNSTLVPFDVAVVMFLVPPVMGTWEFFKVDCVHRFLSIFIVKKKKRIWDSIVNLLFMTRIMRFIHQFFFPLLVFGQVFLCPFILHYLATFLASPDGKLKSMNSCHFSLIWIVFIKLTWRTRTKFMMKVYVHYQVILKFQKYFTTTISAEYYLQF
jgi:hypothetical protein